MVHCQWERTLTEEEREAASSHGSNAILFHACLQGRSDEVSNQSGFDEFRSRVKNQVTALDAAIETCSLTEAATLYSGHGRGLFVRGALSGDAKKFVGLTYQYRGYISTSSSRDFAVSFLAKRAESNSLPTLMEFRLPTNFPVLDMNCAGHHGEFEFLLGRNRLFKIVDANEIRLRDVAELVLHLVLESHSSPSRSAN